MNLSEREAQLFNLLNAGQAVTMDALIKELGGSRQSITVNVKYLAAKIAAEGWVITNSGGVGRSNKAIFLMEKKFGGEQ